MITLGVSNALTSSIAKIFHPIVYGVAWMLAFIYGLIPNYAVAIAILTVIIMALLTPLTVKSTRSMVAMQKLQPELKRLQQKYKGPEHRQELNEEMMRLYREEGVNPATGCITGLLQAPFLFILYSVIRGLSQTVVAVHGKALCGSYVPKIPSSFNGLVSCPRNIPASSKMFRDITSLAHPAGAMLAWGMNLALKPFSAHDSIWAAIPFYCLVVVAVGVQYFQMSQLNRRNQNTSQMSSQMLMFQRITPILFAYIYFIVPAAAVVYMVFSSLIRILTQDLIFRFDTNKPAKPKERDIPGASGEPAELDVPSDVKTDVKTDGKVTPVKSGTGRNGATAPAKPAAKAVQAAKVAPPSHPRSRDKKKRKAR